MSDLRLEDIGAIMEGLLLVGVGLFSVMALIALWPKIRAVAWATWHRYVAFSWDDLMAWMADIDQERVNSFEDDGAYIMSRSVADEVRLSGPSLQTRPSQAPDQTEDPAARRKKLLDTYTPLKRHGFSRDEARAVLSLWGIPLDNNLWAQVPMEDDSPYTTPIAGRPTRATFETDPELVYQQPPQ